MAYRGLVLAASVGGLMVVFQTLPDGFFGAAAATARHPWQSATDSVRPVRPPPSCR
jgi:hypothetical protein